MRWKGVLPALLLSILILCTVSFSAGLYIGKKQIIQTVVIDPTTTENITISKRVVVSKKGSKYYPWWCTASRTLSQKNRLWFSSSFLAEQAGYTRSKQCE